MFNFSKELAQWQKRIYQEGQLHNDLRTMCKKQPDDYNDIFVLWQNILIVFGPLDGWRWNTQTAVSHQCSFGTFHTVHQL